MVSTRYVCCVPQLFPPAFYKQRFKNHWEEQEIDGRVILKCTLGRCLCRSEMTDLGQTCVQQWTAVYTTVDSCIHNSGLLYTQATLAAPSQTRYAYGTQQQTPCTPDVPINAGRTVAEHCMDLASCHIRILRRPRHFPTMCLPLRARIELPSADCTACRT
jgi:hypothetical protein